MPWKKKEEGLDKTMQKPLVTLENWAVVESVIASDYEELRPGKHLMGKVFGHVSLPDAKLIYTSRIQSVHPNRRLVETANTVYRLGEPSDGYKAWEQKRSSAAA
jgi:hypothetical protein